MIEELGGQAERWQSAWSGELERYLSVGVDAVHK